MRINTISRKTANLMSEPNSNRKTATNWQEIMCKMCEMSEKEIHFCINDPRRQNGRGRRRRGSIHKKKIYIFDFHNGYIITGNVSDAIHQHQQQKNCVKKKPFFWLFLYIIIIILWLLRIFFNKFVTSFFFYKLLLYGVVVVVVDVMLISPGLKRIERWLFSSFNWTRKHILFKKGRNDVMEFSSSKLLC